MKKLFSLLILSLLLTGCYTTDEPLKYNMGSEINIYQIKSNYVKERHKFFNCEDTGIIIDYRRAHVVLYHIKFDCYLNKERTVSVTKTFGTDLEER